MSKHKQVIVDGELYIPFNESIKRCEYCVRDVNVCNRIYQCVKNNMKYFVLRPSLKRKLKGDGMSLLPVELPETGRTVRAIVKKDLPYREWYLMTVLLVAVDEPDCDWRFAEGNATLSHDVDVIYWEYEK